MIRTVVAGVALAAALAGCGVRLARDDRLRFLSPPDRAEVTSPVVVKWRMRGFHTAPFDGSTASTSGVFAVFVDSAPMRPGKGIASLAAHDPVCNATPGCPDRVWLSEHGVYLTTRSQIELPALPLDRGSKASGSLRRHEVTVVLLNGRGTRIGESAWTLTLYVRGA